ncbi:unnamed protein product [Fusarium equiseti]|uniref:Xylanolytic transcriptional activator regulatory domain-containing protein n=1 Tax=Fusarium equiseti TaxID=61235 RepID=A0A8J2IVL7_FUSEQ|nr:unnamed protein product [Fusarium equiseti]
MGNLNLTDEWSVYTGSSHWATILEDIQQLKDDLSDDFSESYANFWANPSATPIIWVGLLFSIMSMSASIQKTELGVHDPSSQELQATLETFRTLTIHCLVAGDYLHASGYVVETLMLHFAIDQHANIATHMGSWVLMGVIIRVAMRMGLHREPSHWPGIRPLRAELRRRAWTFLYSVDFFTSTQVGLPRIIKDSQCDTRPPSYLLDSDISTDSDALPPERPFSEPSMLAFHIKRHGVIKVAAEIYDTTEAGPPSPAVVTALEAKLQSVVDALPNWLKPKPLKESIADSPSIILNRMMLDIIIQKAMYLLHRHSFINSSAREDNSRSYEACIGAALAILEYQRRMKEEAQPGGLMYAIRWRISAPLNHDFLQATMMLCHSLSKYDARCALDRREDILQALIVAKNIWEQSSDRSTEAQRAIKAISVMLEQDRKTSVSLPVKSSVPEVSFFGPAEDTFDVFDNTFGQTMALDPSFFSVQDDMPTLSSVITGYMTDTVAPGLSGSLFETMS